MPEVPIGLSQARALSAAIGEGSVFVSSNQTLYNVSWLLVHYLLNGDGQQHRAAFRKWAADVGTPRNTASLAAAIGIPVNNLSGRLKVYLEKIK